MRRSFGLETLLCPRCGGRLRLIALIDQPAVIACTLRHLGLATEIPAPRPGRAPPTVLPDDAASGDASARRARRPAVDDDALFEVHAHV